MFIALYSFCYRMLYIYIYTYLTNSHHLIQYFRKDQTHGEHRLCWPCLAEKRLESFNQFRHCLGLKPQVYKAHSRRELFAA